eukprot:6168625-Amphidinium_carterae.1
MSPKLRTNRLNCNRVLTAAAAAVKAWCSSLCGKHLRGAHHTVKPTCGAKGRQENVCKRQLLGRWKKMDLVYPFPIIFQQTIAT